MKSNNTVKRQNETEAWISPAQKEEPRVYNSKDWMCPRTLTMLVADSLKSLRRCKTNMPEDIKQPLTTWY